MGVEGKYGALINTSIHERKTDKAECKWKQPSKDFGN
jgi:hypothetical protein